MGGKGSEAGGSDRARSSTPLPSPGHSPSAPTPAFSPSSERRGAFVRFGWEGGAQDPGARVGAWRAGRGGRQRWEAPARGPQLPELQCEEGRERGAGTGRAAPGRPPPRAPHRGHGAPREPAVGAVCPATAAAAARSR